MYAFEETELTGIGRSFTIVTSSSHRLIIVVHDSGMVELYYATPDDPLKILPVATLTDDEARLVAAIIGRTIYRSEAIERLSKHGVAIRWHLLKPNSYAIGKTVGELFPDTGVAVLEVVEKDGKSHTCPSNDYIFHEGSQVALSGNKRHLDKVEEILDKEQ